MKTKKPKNKPKAHLEDEVADAVADAAATDATIQADQDGEIVEVTVEQWALNFQNLIMQELEGLIEEQAVNYGNDFGDMVRLQLIASLVATTTYRCISTQDPTVKDLHTQTELNNLRFKDLKEALCHALASGLEGALMEFSGDKPDYEVSIKLLPPAANKLVC